MTMPGFITGQPISGQGLGNALFLFGPCFPTEGPPGMPRVLAKQLFPRGFFPGMIPAIPALPAARPAPPVQPLIPPAGIPAQPQPAPAAANQVVRPPAQPAPRKRVLERGTFPEWH
ncbi:hypothetical protein ES703_50645 [subsurface metagenome]